MCVCVCVCVCVSIIFRKELYHESHVSRVNTYQAIVDNQCNSLWLKVTHYLSDSGTVYVHGHTINFCAVDSTAYNSSSSSYYYLL